MRSSDEFFTGLLAAVLIVVLQDDVRAEIVAGQADHTCYRSCEVPTRPRVCYFQFKVESYLSMSRACGNCPFNSTECELPECVPTNGLRKRITVVNRQLPGPSIIVCIGDKVVVDVKNADSAQSISIHWHGLMQHWTPFMDGVPYVTQCPISPGTTFRYAFNASENGTYLYHSHSGMQKANGLFGALIIRKPNDPKLRDYDRDLPEHIILVNDWLNDPAEDRLELHNQGNGTNKPDSILVNGRGRLVPYRDGDGRDYYTPYEIFKVERGLRYRFRLISAGILNCPIQFSVDGHQLSVIATDGNPVRTKVVDSLVIYSGERFDFVLHTNRSVGNFWMKFNGLLDCDARFNGVHSAAILRYDGADEVSPSGLLSYSSTKQGGTTLNPLNTPTTATLLNVDTLRSIMPETPASRNARADMQLYVSYDFFYVKNPLFNEEYSMPTGGSVRIERPWPLPLLDRIHFEFPSSPLLSQLEDIAEGQLCTAETLQNSCVNDFCSCTHIVKVALNSVVEIVFVDEGVAFYANHPLHLHGHNFRVVAMGRLGENTTVKAIKKLDSRGGIKRRTKSAVMKDTVTVPDGGYTIVRFYANNPGFWMLHCHTDFHLETGMALVFQVGEKKDFMPIPNNFPRCGNFQ